MAWRCDKSENRIVAYINWEREKPITANTRKLWQYASVTAWHAATVLVVGFHYSQWCFITCPDVLLDFEIIGLWDRTRSLDFQGKYGWQGASVSNPSLGPAVAGETLQQANRPSLKIGTATERDAYTYPTHSATSTILCTTPTEDNCNYIYAQYSGFISMAH